MTACFKLMKALQPKEQHQDDTSPCNPCVYFSKNLDTTEYPASTAENDLCGLGFRPGDNGCNEMRTNNCSAGKDKA